MCKLTLVRQQLNHSDDSARFLPFIVFSGSRAAQLFFGMNETLETEACIKRYESGSTVLSADRTRGGGINQDVKRDGLI